MNASTSRPVKRLSDVCRVDIRLRADTAITLSGGQGETATMTYNAGSETFEADRTKGGNTGFLSNFATVTKALTYGKINTLRIFIDKSSTEVFDADEKMAISNIVLPSSLYTQFTVKGGKVRTYRSRQ